MKSSKHSDIFVLNNGERIPIVITTKSGIKNITLRPKTCSSRELHISLPRWTSASRAYKFIDEKRTWLNRAFAKQTEKMKLSPGDMIMLFGEKFEIVGACCTRPKNLSCAETMPGVCNTPLQISGNPEFFERRLRDKIKEMFLQKTKEIIREVPRELRPIKISVRDTTTRWGSCSSTGTISLSWRLSFAPYEVMRYVIMHEIAHRRHMNHSADFWALTGELYGPGYERAKAWLTKHGHELHRYL